MPLKSFGEVGLAGILDCHRTQGVLHTGGRESKNFSELSQRPFCVYLSCTATICGNCLTRVSGRLHIKSSRRQQLRQNLIRYNLLKRFHWVLQLRRLQWPIIISISCTRLVHSIKRHWIHVMSSVTPAVTMPSPSCRNCCSLVFAMWIFDV